LFVGDERGLKSAIIACLLVVHLDLCHSAQQKLSPSVFVSEREKGTYWGDRESDANKEIERVRQRVRSRKGERCGKGERKEGNRE
jgi:hypothetical protein